MRRVLLDEHVGRVFEHVLSDRGYDVIQAKDQCGERTTDRNLLRWSGQNDVPLISNNAKDFEPLHREENHAGLLLYDDQSLPDDDPERLARAVDAIRDQYGAAALENEIVSLDTWYDYLQE